jgi:hypothetical protein
MLKRKYLKTQMITHVQKKLGDSQFWSGLIKVKDSFLSLGHFKLNNGVHIRFWEDKWLGYYTLQHHFPSLYTIVCRKNVSMAKVFSSVPRNISFWRGLVCNNLSLWHGLVAMVVHIKLNGAADSFIWWLHQNGQFFVKSMHSALIADT